MRRWQSLAAAAAITAASFAATLFVLGVPSKADERVAADTLRGFAHVSDGDTIVIGGAIIRIHGIDAPEAGQSCNRRLMGTWPCGTAATAALARMVEGRDVSCQFKTRDKYKRLVSVCRVGDRDIGAEMVRLGLAWAFVRYAQDYVGLEAEARAAKVGIWQAATETAWDYRANAWQTAQNGAPEGCPIKGNVSAKGERIYHTPWSPWYAKVRMDTDKGKRWFCSEDEAIKAGWRPALTH